MGMGAQCYGEHSSHNWGDWKWDHSGEDIAWYDWMRNEPNDWHTQNCLTFLKDQTCLASESIIGMTGIASKQPGLSVSVLLWSDHSLSLSHCWHNQLSDCRKLDWINKLDK